MAKKWFDSIKKQKKKQFEVFFVTDRQTESIVDNNDS